MIATKKWLIYCQKTAVYNMPTFFLLFQVENALEGMVSLAIALEDKDAYPIVDFAWIHWLAANIARFGIKDNESQSAKDFMQGLNSWACRIMCNDTCSD